MQQSGARFFRVEELPLYEPSGSGPHLYLEVEKRDLTSEVVAAALARAFDRPGGAVGFAGRKDRRAVTRQWFSLEGASPLDAGEVGREVRIGGGAFRVLSQSRHQNKLRTGHLRGNRFALGLDPGLSLDRLDAALSDLARAGVRNHFGPQRFGPHGANLAIARAWARGDAVRAVAWIVDPVGGQWRPGDALPRVDRRDPRGRVIAALARDVEAQEALRAAGPSFRKLIASSAQAAVFNAVLAGRERAGRLHRLAEGDLAIRPGRRAPFRCVASDVPALCREISTGEVSPTGPLPGRSKFTPSPQVEAEEREWARELDIDWAWFDRGGTLRSAGDRRALLVHFLEAPRLAREEDGVWLRFALPRGSFATQVLAELQERSA